MPAQCETYRISSVLLSRFLLDLRELHAHPDRTTMSQSENIALSDMKFNSATVHSSRTKTNFGSSTVVHDFEDPAYYNTTCTEGEDLNV